MVTISHIPLLCSLILAVSIKQLLEFFLRNQILASFYSLHWLSIAWWYWIENYSLHLYDPTSRVLGIFYLKPNVIPLPSHKTSFEEITHAEFSPLH